MDEAAKDVSGTSAKLEQELCAAGVEAGAEMTDLAFKLDAYASDLDRLLEQTR